MESLTVALITGANGGIGRAVAEILTADHRYHIIIGSRRVAGGQDIANSLKSRDIFAAAAYISETFGKLNVLVNNAAVHFAVTHSLPVREQWTYTFATNVVGTVVLTDKLLSLLRKSEFPWTVFINSTKGSMGATLDTTLALQDLTFNSYDASKAAVNMLIVGYAKVLKDVRGVANAVCPGLVDTKMTASMGGEILASHGAVSIELGAR